LRRKILIVRRENIGDLILTTPLIASLRLAMPGAYIAALVNSYNAPVLAGNDDIDEVFVYTKGKHADSFWGRLRARLDLIRLFLHLRRAGFDEVVLAEPTYTARNIRLAQFVVGGSGRANRRIVGFEDDDGTRTGLDVAISKANMDGLHQAEIMMRLASAFGGAAISGTTPGCRVVAPSLSAGRDITELVVGLHISARKPSQRWSVEKFAALVVAIFAGRAPSCRVKIHVFWSPGAADNALHPGDDDKAVGLQAALAEALAAVGAGAAGTYALVPTHGLDELISGLAKLDVLVCADGGAMHIAAGLGKPIVALFGDSNPVRWRPWGVPHRVLQGDSRDVAAISVKEVLSAFDGLVKECHLGCKSHQD
jgi:ADP-heptose:LPS heptosyltransferase